MVEADVITALRDKRSELVEIVEHLEQQVAQRRGDLVHVDATMRLFDPGVAADIEPHQKPRVHNAWFRQGECLRLIYDVVRDAPRPMATREITEQVMAAKGIATDDDRTRELIQKTVLGSLNRTPATIQRIETAGVVTWRVI